MPEERATVTRAIAPHQRQAALTGGTRTSKKHPEGIETVGLIVATLGVTMVWAGLDGLDVDYLRHALVAVTVVVWVPHAYVLVEHSSRANAEAAFQAALIAAYRDGYADGYVDCVTVRRQGSS